MTFTAAGEWASAQNELVRAGEVKLGAICHSDLPAFQKILLQDLEDPALRDSARKSLESGDPLQAFMTSYFVSGDCQDLPRVTISGQPGLICEYDHYVQAVTSVNDTMVLIHAETADGVTPEIKSIVSSASISLD